MKPLTAEQQKTVEDNHKLIYFLLNKYKLSYEKYYGIVAEGLCKAAQRYEADKGKFSTFAIRVMLNAIISDKRKEKSKKRGLFVSIPLNEEMIAGYESDPLDVLIEKENAAERL